MKYHSNDLIMEIVFPESISRIKISDARREVHYNVNKHIIPKKLQNTNLYSTDNKGYIIDKVTLNKIVKNFRSAGKPRYLTINFQAIWNGTIHRYSRADMVKNLEK